MIQNHIYDIIIVNKEKALIRKDINYNSDIIYIGCTHDILFAECIFMENPPDVDLNYYKKFKCPIPKIDLCHKMNYEYYRSFGKPQKISYEYTCLFFDKIPSSWNTVIFSNAFNISLKNCRFPENITRIIFGERFNKKINKNILPKNLDYIEFGYFYKKPLIKELFPDTVTSVKFNGTYLRNCKIHFPDSVKKIIIVELQNLLIRGKIKSLYIQYFDKYSYNKKLLSSLENVYVSCYKNEHFDDIKKIIQKYTPYGCCIKKIDYKSV